MFAFEHMMDAAKFNIFYHHRVFNIVTHGGGFEREVYKCNIYDDVVYLMMFDVLKIMTEECGKNI